MRLIASGRRVPGPVPRERGPGPEAVPSSATASVKVLPGAEFARREPSGRDRPVEVAVRVDVVEGDLGPARPDRQPVRRPPQGALPRGERPQGQRRRPGAPSGREEEQLPLPYPRVDRLEAQQRNARQPGEAQRRKGHRALPRGHDELRRRPGPQGGHHGDAGQVSGAPRQRRADGGPVQAAQGVGEPAPHLRADQQLLDAARLSGLGPFDGPPDDAQVGGAEERGQLLQPGQQLPQQDEASGPLTFHQEADGRHRTAARGEFVEPVAGHPHRSAHPCSLCRGPDVTPRGLPGRAAQRSVGASGGGF